jgi:hypothetical protein
MSPTARLIHLKNQRTPTRRKEKEDRTFVEKIQSSEKQVGRDKANRTTHSYYPKPIRESLKEIEDREEKRKPIDDKGLMTLQAENIHERRTEAYRSNGGSIANIQLA